MTQAIRTRYLAPTNTKGTRVKATCKGGSVTLPWDYEVDTEENHVYAAWALIEKLRWQGNIRGGMLDNGDYAFVFVEVV